MKLYLFLILSLLTCNSIFAQTPYVYTIKADSVKLTGCDSDELIIENHTQNVPGFLFNTGNGRTQFRRGLLNLGGGAYQIGADTLNVPTNAWLQGGNAFGTTGILGTLDNNHLDFYTNHTRAARLDSLGNLLLGTTTSGNFKLDVAGTARVSSYLDVTAGDSYDVQIFPYNGEYWGSYGSSIFFGNIYASIGVLRTPLGTIPANSMVIGGTSPNTETAICDYNYNPVFVAGGSGNATINGGYSGISQGGSGGGGNSNAFDFVINGCRGTGAGLPGDILFSTGTSQDSSAGIHPMTARWFIKGGTGNLSNTSTPTSSLDITGATGYSQFRLRTSYTPTSTSDTNGNTGDFSWDSSYFYIKTPSGWMRAALSTF
jgi:hypothetical protein